MPEIPVLEKRRARDRERYARDTDRRDKTKARAKKHYEINKAAILHKHRQQYFATREQRRERRRMHRDEINARERETYHLRKEKQRDRKEVERAIRASAALAKLGRQPRTLDEWFPTQVRFRTWSEFARTVGVELTQVWHWRKGTYVPDGRERRQLVYELTGIELREPCLSVEWASKLWSELREYAATTRLTAGAQRQRNVYTFDVLCRLQKSAGNPGEIVPSMLFQSAPRRQSRRLTAKIAREVLPFMGRFLVARGFWTVENLDQLTGFLDSFRAQDYRYRSSKKAGQAGRKIPLIYDLVLRCGLSNKQIRELRAADVSAEGIRLSPAYLIRYGNEWHQVPRAHVDEYIQSAQPRADGFLFYQLHPLDFFKGASSMWVVETMKRSGIRTQFRVTSRVSHFAGDLVLARSLRALRIHLQHDHNFSGVHAANLALKTLKRSNELPVPLPYRSAIGCISRVFDCTGEVEQGGRLVHGVWADPQKQFQIRIHYPLSLWRELADGRRKTHCAGLLLRLTESFLRQQAKVKPAEVREAIDRELLKRLLLVRVEVCELESGIQVEGLLMKRRGPAHGRFTLPFLEALQSSSVPVERVPASRFKQGKGPGEMASILMSL